MKIIRNEMQTAKLNCNYIEKNKFCDWGIVGYEVYKNGILIDNIINMMPIKGKRR